jgi:hypothetical protein
MTLKLSAIRSCLNLAMYIDQAVECHDLQSDFHTMCFRANMDWSWIDLETG